MKFLAIDYGQKRIGVATSDESETFALPFDTLEYSSGRAGSSRAIGELIKIIEREEIAAIVIGLPKDSSGEAGAMEIETRAFAAALESALQRAKLPLEISWWDERFSTASVLKNLRASGVSQKRARDAGGKESIDARAATIILQDFLDARKLRASFENFNQDSTESEDVF